MTQGAIVVGASSGIGEALARRLAKEGYEIGLAARRTDRLEEIGAELPTEAYVATMDVTETEAARDSFSELTEAMESVDVVVISAGVVETNPELEWEPERRTIDVNVRGFTAIATAAMHYFEEHATPGDETDGHLVGLSSVAAHFGAAPVQAYNASKAFVSNYLQGLRARQTDRDADIAVTTVEPGFVDTKMSYGDIWKCSPETAAAQIARAIEKGRAHVYVTRRWRLAAWVVDLLPDFVLRRLSPGL